MDVNGKDNMITREKLEQELIDLPCLDEYCIEGRDIGFPSGYICKACNGTNLRFPTLAKEKPAKTIYIDTVTLTTKTGEDIVVVRPPNVLHHRQVHWWLPEFTL